jgi:signal peptidase I
MVQCWQKLTILIVTLGIIIPQPGWGDPPGVTAPIFSEAFCLKIFEEVAEKARSSSWRISDRDRHILTQCRTKFPPTANSQIPLPTANECLNVVKTLIQGGISKVKEIELPEEQVRSIERCDEVIKYYFLSSENMLPTLKSTDRVVVDQTAYQQKAPQRGDIVVFNLSPSTQVEKPQSPLIQRAIGLPGETVAIKNGRVYINGRLYQEDYIDQVDHQSDRSTVVPANKYFVIGDNRNSSTKIQLENIISKDTIIGKVIWHFGNR